MLTHFKLSKKSQLAITLLFTSCFAIPGYTDSLSANETPLLIAGSYKADKVYAPLILKKDVNEKWSFTKNLPLANNLDHFVESIDCTGSNCIAAGRFGNNVASSLPLLLISTDNGHTWSYIQSIKALPKMEFSDITSVNCNGATCFASGSFYPTFPHSKIKPLLLVSQDSGLSWSSINVKNNVPKNHALSQVHCENGVCVGIAASDNKARPFVSKDQGVSWAYVPKIKYLPRDVHTEIASIKCSNNICVGVGNFTTNNKRQPMVILSEDNGSHWSYIEKIEELPALKYGRLTSLTLGSKIWLATGAVSMTPSTERVVPIILLSKDQGKHWQFVKRIHGTTNKSTRLGTITCADDLCIAAGYSLLNAAHDADGYEMPAIFMSTDAGESWHFIKHIFLRKVKGASVRAVHCNRGNCIAVGHYDDPRSGDAHSEAIRMPLLLISKNQGMDWTHIEINDLPTIQSGELEAISRK